MSDWAHVFLHEMRNAGLAGILQSLRRLKRVYARSGFAKMRICPPEG
jgi:hypothetical protein